VILESLLHQFLRPLSLPESRIQYPLFGVCMEFELFSQLANNCSEVSENPSTTFTAGHWCSVVLPCVVRGCRIVSSRWQARPLQKEQAMRDNLRRDRAIGDAFTPGYPGQPTGTVARHWTPRAALLSGMVGSQSTPRPSVATTMPDGAKPESRGKRWARWLDHERIVAAGDFLPSVALFWTP
jgi:hypothetical protein